MNADVTTPIGLVVLGVGTVLTVAGVAAGARRWLRSRAWAEETARGDVKSFRRFDGPGQLPRPGDVERAIDHATKLIDPGLFYTADLLRSYVSVNPGALRVLRHDDSDPTRLTGYYILLGLTKRAEDLILEGAIDTGVAITQDLTVHDPGKADALYLGMVQGFGSLGRAGALLSLLDHVSGINAEIKRTEPLRVYARRGTGNSARLMEGLDFRPVRGDRGIEVAFLPNDGVDTIRRALIARVIGV